MGEIDLDRRSFLVSSAVVAGGLALTLMPAESEAARGKGRPLPWLATDPVAAEFSPWVSIGPDDVVVVRISTPEVGNGAATQLAAYVVEELDCAWSDLRIEFASVQREFAQKGSFNLGLLPFFSGHGTDHSRMKRAFQVGASARERLKAAAAARWKVPVAEIDTKDSLLIHRLSGRKLRYGQIAAEAAVIKLEAEPKPRPPGEWRIIGKTSPGKIEDRDIVKGASVFGVDVQLPGMVYAALLQSPVHGGKLKSHDPSAVLKMPGVRAVVVVDPSKSRGSPVRPKFSLGHASTVAQSAVAVIADHYWQAKKALDALPVEWEAGPGAAWKDDAQIDAAVNAVLDRGGGKPLRQTGDIASITSGRTIEGRYHTPFCENAAMEPLNGTALVTADKVELWHPTQDQMQAFWVAVDETGMAPEKVQMHQTFVGGGFGRRSLADDVRMVVAVAKEYPGVPVKLIWSREETMRQGRYRTPITTDFKARLGDDGLPKALEVQACFSGLQLNFGLADTPYVMSGIIPNVKVSGSEMPLHVMTGAYRGPCYNSHAYMVEGFIDECAVAAGIDPLDYRIRLLSTWDDSWVQCLKVASAKAGWGTPLPKGQGRGIAIANWPLAGVKKASSTICTVAHVEVSKEGALRVHQIDVAFDCGRVANRSAVLAQIEGGVIFGLNAALNEALTIRDGTVVEGNFDEYPMLRMADMPRINVHFDALSGHDRYSMMGEAPVGPIGAAVGNAIFQATGKRIRSTPFRKQDLSWS